MRQPADLKKKTQPLLTFPGVHPLIAEILSWKTVTAADGTTRPLHSAIPFEEGMLIQQMILESEDVKTTLEVGCAYGASSMFICQALAHVGGTKHIIIDPFEMGSGHTGPDAGYEGIGLLNVKRAGFEQLVEFYADPSYRRLPLLEAAGVKLDFAFIDGMHTFDYVLTDFFYIDKMLRVGGVVVFDDLSYASIRKVCRYIMRNLPYEAIRPKPTRSRGKRRIAERLAAAVPVIGRLVRSELVNPDETIGVPKQSFFAIRKMKDDAIGDGPQFTRKWDTHHRF